VPEASPERAHWLRILLIGRNPRLTLVRAVILGALTVWAFKAAIIPVRVRGGSMLPTFQDRGVNFLNRLVYLRHPPERGDVVGIRYAGPSIMLLKRVVGLPGERIGFHAGRVTVNGEPLDEPYVKFPSDWERDPVQLGPDEYFVVGDNRSMPIELHTFGVAKRERILGKTLL
jgi:signal peptidase I